MSRPSLSARFGPWVAILGAVIATLTFVHKGVSQVEQIPAIIAAVDSLRAQAVIDHEWKHDMAYMACVTFQKSHPTEVPAVCEKSTK